MGKEMTMRVLEHYLIGYKDPQKKSRYDVPFVKNYAFFKEILLNKRNPNKGGLSFNLGPIPSHFSVLDQRKGDYCLSKGGNISSIYWVNKNLPFAWGDIQHPKTKIRTSDGLIMILSPDIQQVEIFIAVGKRNMVKQVYQAVCDGFLDHEIEYHRSNYHFSRPAA